MRIGHGFDIHRLEPGLPFKLGGIKIPFHSGCVAHSDGDVLLHATCDALLGAAALGDIGRHFPDTDPQYAQADSRQLLRYIKQLLNQHAFKIMNIDSTILAEAPKLAPYINIMQVSIAKELMIEVSAVSIKAKTMEQLGPIGAQKAIAAHVVVLLS